MAGSFFRFERSPLDVCRYAIDDSAGDWQSAQAQVAALAAAMEKGDTRNLSSVVSVKAPAKDVAVGEKKRKAEEGSEGKKGGKKGRTSTGGGGGKKSKK